MGGNHGRGLGDSKEIESLENFGKAKSSFERAKKTKFWASSPTKRSPKLILRHQILLFSIGPQLSFRLAVRPSSCLSTSTSCQYATLWLAQTQAEGSNVLRHKAH